MDLNPFPPELRTMAIVPRWCILGTTLKDNVATHTFFVTCYSYMVAEIIGWKGPRDYLMLDALMHDNDETISSDITGPAKPTIMSKDGLEMLEEESRKRMGGLWRVWEDMQDKQEDDVFNESHAIVLVADKLDALLFLVLNKRMGNSLVEPAIIGGHRSLEGSWRNLPASKELLDKTWNTVVQPSIAEHLEKGARGFAPGVNI